MTRESVSEGFGYEDMGTVLWVPTLTTPTKPKLTELAAGTPITYDLYGASGYNLEQTINERPITRYTLGQELSAEGTTKYKLTMLYVFNRETPTEAETTIGVRGTAGYIVHFLGYENGWDMAAGDIITDIVPIRTGRSTVVPATANTEAHKQTVPSITGKVLHEVPIAA